ncbi:MAG: hypothetical protein GF408_02565 [Candidatus Omnitrophica bacterium]|nr:hypothetical protein [Candidatus Omnitrophota bacterium]
MSDIVIEKFYEWKRGLTSVKAAVNIFEKVRDIPFAVIPELFRLEKGPREMLVLNRGFCVPKHYLMGMFFERMDFPVRYCTYPFLWKDLDVAYPEDVRRYAGKIPVSYHLALKAKIGGKWLFIDGTWDPPLAQEGFPVNTGWEGKDDMLNAVEPLEEIVNDSAIERDRLFLEKLRNYSLSEKLNLARFSVELNRWLEEVRNKKGAANGA